MDSAIECWLETALSNAFTEVVSAVLMGEGTFASAPPSILSDLREVLLAASDGRKERFPSSSLSDGLRGPSAILFLGDPLRTGSDMADGSNVSLPSSMPVRDDWPCFCPFGAILISVLGRSQTKSRLLPLRIGSGLLESSELPVPRMTTGVSLSRKKSSISALVVLVILLLRLEGVRFRLSLAVPPLAERPILPPLVELPLRPLTAYLP